MSLRDSSREHRERCISPEGLMHRRADSTPPAGCGATVSVRVPGGVRDAWGTGRPGTSRLGYLGLARLRMSRAHRRAARIGMAVSKIQSSGSVLAPQHFAGWCCAHRTNIPEVAGQSRRVPRHLTESFLLTLPGCGPPDPPTVDCADAGGGQRTDAVARSPRRPWRCDGGRGPASA